MVVSRGNTDKTFHTNPMCRGHKYVILFLDCPDVRRVCCEDTEISSFSMEKVTLIWLPEWCMFHIKATS